MVVTDKKYLKKAVDLIYKELELIRKENLTSDELVKAKEQLKGHIALSLDSNMELMFNLGKSIIIHNKIDSIQEVYRQIDEINLPEIQSSLEAFFNRDQMSELIYKF